MIFFSSKVVKTYFPVTTCEKKSVSHLCYSLHLKFYFLLQVLFCGSISSQEFYVTFNTRI